jgi:hypothetical protein
LLREIILLVYGYNGYNEILQYTLSYRLNGHAGAMKSKGKQNILAQMSFVLRSKNGLGETKGVSNVQHTIHVRIRKCDQERFLVGRVAIVALVDARLFPFRLNGAFVRAQGVAFGRAALVVGSVRVCVRSSSSGICVVHGGSSCGCIVSAVVCVVQSNVLVERQTWATFVVQTNLLPFGSISL